MVKVILELAIPEHVFKTFRKMYPGDPNIKVKEFLNGFRHVGISVKILEWPEKPGKEV